MDAYLILRQLYLMAKVINTFLPNSNIHFFQGGISYVIPTFVVKSRLERNYPFIYFFFLLRKSVVETIAFFF